MATPWLFFGPDAVGQATQFAQQTGRLGRHFKGLTADTSREVIAEMQAPPVGDRVVCVLVCLDDVDDKVQDVLLKTLEEPLGDETLLVLYCGETSHLRETLWSRVHPKWCPGSYPVPVELIQRFRTAGKDFLEITKVLKELDPKDDLVGAVSALVQDGFWPPSVWADFRSCGKGKVSQVSALTQALCRNR